MRFRYQASPFGDLMIAGDDAGLRWICFPNGRHAVEPGPDWTERSRDPLLRETAGQLREYFAGRRRAFDLPLEPEGTPFQRQVWRRLQVIPYGATLSYAALAAALGRPRAFRAVGAANGRNPISIVIPCHRLLGSDGGLTDYGGGLEAKRALLELEAARPRNGRERR